MNFDSLKQTRFYKKLKAFLAQGLSPNMMALSITIGVVIGLMPLLVVNMWVILLLALFIRINVPLALFINYAIWPVHLMMILPFIKLGCITLRVPMNVLDIDHFKNAFATNIMDAFQDMGGQILCGLLGWMIISIPLSLAIFFGSRRMLALRK